MRKTYMDGDKYFIKLDDSGRVVKLEHADTMEAAMEVIRILSENLSVSADRIESSRNSYKQLKHSKNNSGSKEKDLQHELNRVNLALTTVNAENDGLRRKVMEREGMLKHLDTELSKANREATDLGNKVEWYTSVLNEWSRLYEWMRRHGFESQVCMRPDSARIEMDRMLAWVEARVDPSLKNELERWHIGWNNLADRLSKYGYISSINTPDGALRSIADWFSTKASRHTTDLAKEYGWTNSFNGIDTEEPEVWEVNSLMDWLRNRLNQDDMAEKYDRLETTRNEYEGLDKLHTFLEGRGKYTARFETITAAFDNIIRFLSDRKEIDLYSLVGSLMFGRKPVDLSASDRQSIKEAFHALSYGGSPEPTKIVDYTKTIDGFRFQVSELKNQVGELQIQLCRSNQERDSLREGTSESLRCENQDLKRSVEHEKSRNKAMDQAVTAWIRRCSISSEKIKELSQHVSQLRDLLEDRQEEVSRLSDWFRYIENGFNRNPIGTFSYNTYYSFVINSINQALEGKYPKES